ncbi:GNAT family N-acetyltransferase [Coleofasciculus sp. FACHB-129]|uniref:GNAT family N-acetyltransferase n=1 Tax=Cyanophyceae TaxID=3028117 RepID=UPI0016880D67|nr:GNAT family N-acetyltransferase [Coleofasciculus sp. FACHB-129]MBD1896201.1 GNAT family N-acetyltransferase [Coleofasciculus sp. FACHB-129]
MTQEIEQLVKDKQGRQYQMKGDYDNESGLLVVKLQYQNQEVGRLQCLLEYPPGEMKIGDLIISDDDDVVEIPRWRKVFKLKPRNYRNKGLGTYLLKFALDFARQKGMTHIYGCLTHKDIATTPGLINWYKKHGFELESPAPKDPSTTAHRISQQL